jgi:predicted phosphohydrolase
MDVFGPAWIEHTRVIQASWDSLVSANDIVLIPGDISWAMRLDEAAPDLQWIHERPGIKVLIRGNHDYWWGSISKLRRTLPPSIHAIQHDVICFDEVAIGGSRLWDTPEVNCSELITMTGEKKASVQDHKGDDEIFQRELARLESSLQLLPKDAAVKIAMTHFPPIGPDLAPTRASALFEKYGVHIVVFGHLHSFKEGLQSTFGTARGVRYILCSGDFLHFTPIRIWP